MHGRADGGSQEYHALYSIISDCLNGSLLWLTNFHNLVNPYMTIKDSGLRHFKDMDKPILIFKDINCLWFFSLASFADYFHSKFASHCRCTKLSVQSGDAELQSEVVAKLLAGLSAGRGANPACNISLAAGAGRQLLQAGAAREFAQFVNPDPGSFATPQPWDWGRGPVRVTTCDFIAELETARLWEPVLVVVVFLMSGEL